MHDGDSNPFSNNVYFQILCSDNRLTSWNNIWGNFVGLTWVFYVGSSNSPFLVFVTQKVPEYSAPVKKKK